MYINVQHEQGGLQQPELCMITESWCLNTGAKKEGALWDKVLSGTNTEDRETQET